MITSLVHAAEDVSRVLVEDDERPVAHVDVSDDGAVVRLGFAVDGGHLPMQARRLLVDAVFALPALKERRAVQATVPLGDSELLAALRRYCAHVDTRPAGATCLIDAEIRP